MNMGYKQSKLVKDSLQRMALGMLVRFDKSTHLVAVTGFFSRSQQMALGILVRFDKYTPLVVVPGFFSRSVLTILMCL